MENIRNNFLSPYQIQILELTSHIRSDMEMDEVRRLVALYFAKKAEDEIDKLWEEGKITDETIENWKNEHMRTPYNQ